MSGNKASRLPNSVRDKIVSLEELAARVRAAKAAGKKVVYAHGVFDLLHVGHVRHLEAARRHGDFLVVTVTADKFVNKGPGRPVFPEHLRAEMLAAVGHVDAVAINFDLTAEKPLRALQPDFYVKGAEYSDAENDLTGKIRDERAIAESFGGEVIFTDEETYSSSNLLNRHFNQHEPVLRSYLDTLRNSDILSSSLKAVDDLKNLKVLVIGDAIIDEYQYVDALGRPSKETILATQFVDKELFAGGAVAAANHIASFCAEVELVTALGGKESYEDLVRDSLRSNVVLTHIVREESPTTRKCRFVNMGSSLKKLFEVYTMDDAPLPAAQQGELNSILSARLAKYDVVVVADFGHGLLHGSTVDLLAKQARYLAVNTQTNSANHGYNVITKYSRADYVCLDGPEARLAVRNKYASAEELVKQLPKVINCERVIVTLGKNGCAAYDVSAGGNANVIHRVPALTGTIVDTVGAGDAFFAVTAPLAFRGLPISTVAFLGNIAGAMKVGIVGHRSAVERVPYTKFLTALLK